MDRGCIFVAALLITGAAHGQTPNPGGDVMNTGMAADIATTALGLALGLSEANPAGLALVPLKLVLKNHIDSIENESERREQSAVFSGVQFGAAAWNLCMLASAGGPAGPLLCFAGGMALGYETVKSIPTTVECTSRHMRFFEEAVRLDIAYKVDLRTCIGYYFSRQDPAEEGFASLSAP